MPEWLPLRTQCGDNKSAAIKESISMQASQARATLNPLIRPIEHIAACKHVLSCLILKTKVPSGGVGSSVEPVRAGGSR